MKKTHFILGNLVILSINKINCPYNRIYVLNLSITNDFKAFFSTIEGLGNTPNGVAIAFQCSLQGRNYLRNIIDSAEITFHNVLDGGEIVFETFLTVQRLPLQYP